MNPSNRKFETSDHDLTKYIQKCKKCSNVILNGKNIIYYENIDGIEITNHDKVAIIMNNQLNIVGHWVILLVLKKQDFRFAIYYDSLNTARYKNTHLFDSIKLFCRKIRLKLYDCSFRIQNSKSRNCGFHSLHLLAKFSHLSFSKFCNYITLLKKNPVRVNDALSIKFVEKHFH